MNYNYVFFQVPHDYYSISLKDALTLSNVRYYNNYPYSNNKILSFLHRLHFSGKIQSIVSLPFKSIWNPYYFKNTFENESPICFIFSGATAIWANYGLIDFLKSRYIGSKYVCFYQDLIATYKYFNINQAKLIFDLVISFDEIDAKNYNILYHPTQYSKITIPENHTIPESDIYFMGAAKNRFNKIISAYEYFCKKGFRCNFNITGVDSKLRKHSNDIKYIKHMPYLENLQHIAKTKAILEIVQTGSKGYTLRTWEAITYNKLLITDNKAFYGLNDNSNGFIILEEEINNWQEIIDRTVFYDPIWQERMSLQNFISFIENHLQLPCIIS